MFSCKGYGLKFFLKDLQLLQKKMTISSKIVLLMPSRSIKHHILLCFSWLHRCCYFCKYYFLDKKCSCFFTIHVPSGIYAAMTTISASNHRQYFTNIEYSALHTSDRCFPVHTPKVAARDWITSAKINAIKITQSSSYLWFAPAWKSVSTAYKI